MFWPGSTPTSRGAASKANARWLQPSGIRSTRSEAMNPLNTLAFTTQEVATYFAVRVPKMRQNGVHGWRGACPIHSGKNDSFTVNPVTGRWFCHSGCGRGGDIFDLEQ